MTRIIIDLSLIILGNAILITLTAWVAFRFGLLPKNVRWAAPLVVSREEQLKMLRQGSDVWNAWRASNINIQLLLSLSDLSKADLSGVDLGSANLSGANLSQTTLSRANLSGADLSGVNLYSANLSGANLSRANLSMASLVETNLANADLTGCRIYGISARQLNVEGAKQENLVITRQDEPEITVDNVEVAQFIYLLLYNQQIRNLIGTITSKAVLIFGRFTLERQQILDALRQELRKRDYVPILFNFDKPAQRNLTQMIATLAGMARFIIADITESRFIPQELVNQIRTAKVPVQPLMLSNGTTHTMLDEVKTLPWVLPPHRYTSPEQLIADLSERVINPAEAKALELQGPKPN